MEANVHQLWLIHRGEFASEVCSPTLLYAQLPSTPALPKTLLLIEYGEFRH
jgi:hypothetical protein